MSRDYSDDDSQGELNLRFRGSITSERSDEDDREEESEAFAHDIMSFNPSPDRNMSQTTHSQARPTLTTAGSLRTPASSIRMGPKSTSRVGEMERMLRDIDKWQELADNTIDKTHNKDEEVTNSAELLHSGMHVLRDLLNDVVKTNWMYN